MDTSKSVIAADQPTIFADDLIVRFSSVNDGTMLDRSGSTHNLDVVSNRRKFCKKVGLEYENCVYQQIQYGPRQTYSKIAFVDEHSTTTNKLGVDADAMITDTPGLALMLPIADCVGTVIYDSTIRKLAMVHLGRHSTLTPLLKSVIEEFQSAGSRLEDIRIWMSPSAKKQTYAIDYFLHLSELDWQDYSEERAGRIYLDLPGYNHNVCIKSGIPAENIEISPINTMTSSDYFSHAAGDKKKRFAVVAVMT